MRCRTIYPLALQWSLVGKSPSSIPWLVKSTGGAPRVPRASLARGLWPCSHVGREEEVVPTLTHHMDTLQERGNCQCGKGFPETVEKPRPR